MGDILSRRRRRNPDGFTTDEARTAQLLIDEGWTTCARQRMNGTYAYPLIGADACDKEQLKPAEKVFPAKIVPMTTKEPTCPKHLFPPEGRGKWTIRTRGREAEKVILKLKPLLTKEFLRKYQETKETCK